MNKLWLVWSLEHNGWWRENSKGYCSDIKAAGRYSFEEASKIVVGANYAAYVHGKKINEAMCPAPESVDYVKG
jgi:hypothetical protein